ncbi:unnamed protein product [Dicrocoelium dendriticum]|nr:unnamed protein product [Dicrocoelium dendriticum]
MDPSTIGFRSHNPLQDSRCNSVEGRRLRLTMSTCPPDHFYNHSPYQPFFNNGNSMRPFSAPLGPQTHAEAYSFDDPSVSVVPDNMVTLLPNPVGDNHVPQRSRLSNCDITPFSSDTSSCKSIAKNRNYNSRCRIDRLALSLFDLHGNPDPLSKENILVGFTDVPSPSSSSDASKTKDQKDQRYLQRRLRNNMAAKRSRDNRKRREDLIALRANYLEKSNIILHAQILALKKEICFLRKIPFDPGYRPIVTESDVISNNPVRPFPCTDGVDISTAVSPVPPLNSTYIFHEPDHSSG